MNKEIYEYAKKYRGIGWNVIPLFNYTKIPSAVNWKEYQDRMATDEEFEEWFTDEGVTGVGVITGKISGIVVLDEDKYKEGGKPVKAETGMKAETARGGLHHFFKYIEPIKSSGLKKDIYVEIKADGGFVVLPPTKVVLDGKEGEYKWITTCYPDELMGITEEMLVPFRGSGTSSVNVVELSHATEGSRHNNLLSIALSLFARFKRNGEWELAERQVRFSAAEMDPPHDERDVERIIRDAKNYVMTHNKEDVNKRIAAQPPMPRTVNDLVEERIADRALEKIAPQTGWPDLDEIIRGFVPGHVYTLTGDTNVGKTTIACNFAEALRQQKKKTLYIALEPDVNLVEYLASVRHNKPFDQITDEELRIEESDRYIKVFLQKDIEDADELVRSVQGLQERFDLIVIDHIGYFVRSEKNWLQQQSNVIKKLATFAKGQKSAVMMIAHLRKLGGGQKKKNYIPGQDDIAGSASFKQDSTEVMIAYRPTKEDEFGDEYEDVGYLRVTKTKIGPNGKIQLFFQPRNAKIWSLKEASQSTAGRMFLETRRLQAQSMEYSKWSQDMKKTEGWSSNDD